MGLACHMARHSVRVELAPATRAGGEQTDPCDSTSAEINPRTHRPNKHRGLGHASITCISMLSAAESRRMAAQAATLDVNMRHVLRTKIGRYSHACHPRTATRTEVRIAPSLAVGWPARWARSPGVLQTHFAPRQIFPREKSSAESAHARHKKNF